MQYTTNYHMNLPQGTDRANIEKLSENMDIVENILYSVAITPSSNKGILKFLTPSNFTDTPYKIPNTITHYFSGMYIPYRCYKFGTKYPVHTEGLCFSFENFNTNRRTDSVPNMLYIDTEFPASTTRTLYSESLNTGDCKMTITCAKPCRPDFQFIVQYVSRIQLQYSDDGTNWTNSTVTSGSRTIASPTIVSVADKIGGDISHKYWRIIFTPYSSSYRCRVYAFTNAHMMATLYTRTLEFSTDDLPTSVTVGDRFQVRMPAFDENNIEMTSSMAIHKCFIKIGNTTYECDRVLTNGHRYEVVIASNSRMYVTEV